MRADLLDDATEARMESGEIGWCAAEIQRAKAARAAAADAQTAERLLLDALAMARRQGALGWALRIATDLAQMRSNRGDVSDARTLLSGTLAQFAEGAATADHRTATALLRSL
jgi:hypothetical protein